MAALDVFKQVGRIVDSDFLALEALPILWIFSLGPLLDLEQFQKFMALIKSFSSRIEREHSQRIRELTATNGTTSTRAKDFTSFGAIPTPNGMSTNELDVDFEALVLGRKQASGSANDMLDGDWNTPVPAKSNIPASKPSTLTPQSSSFAWSRSTSNDFSAPPSGTVAWAASPTTRAITPDANMSAFAALTPSSPFNNPLQPSRPSNNIASQISSPPLQPQTTASTIDWSTTTKAASNPWLSSPPQTNGLTNATSNGFPSAGGYQPSTSTSGFPIASPPSSQLSSFSIAPPPTRLGNGHAQTQPTMQNLNLNYDGGVGMRGQQQQQGANSGNQSQGLDKYESLL